MYLSAQSQYQSRHILTEVHYNMKAFYYFTVTMWIILLTLAVLFLSEGKYIVLSYGIIGFSSVVLFITNGIKVYKENFKNLD